MIVAIAGGVGGAKLALGLTLVEAPERLLVAVNTGDDFTHLGLHISPDLDSMMYALAGIENPETGWGLANETWSFMQMLERLGGETWFKLGDRDLATHVERTRQLADGSTLSEVTGRLCRQLGIRQTVLPMSDDKVRTIVLFGDQRISGSAFSIILLSCNVVRELMVLSMKERRGRARLLSCSNARFSVASGHYSMSLKSLSQYRSDAGHGAAG